MVPYALQIGSFSIHWYGVMAAIGFLIASYLLGKNYRFVNGLTKDQCDTMIIIALVAGLIGARTYHVIEFFHEDGFDRDLLSIFYLHRGGLVFYGGFILAFVSVVFYTRKHKLDTIRVLDVFIPSLTAAHACGRIGCFLNGCCHGKATTWFWGVTAPQGSLLWFQTGGQAVHPAQLVEAGENFLLCLLYCWMLRKTKRGIVTATFLIVYGVLRCINETLRGDNVLYFHLTPAQWIGLLLIPAGIGLLCIFSKNEKHI